LAPPNDEREIVRHYTLSRDDLDLIAGKRSGHSRLGFAVLLCYMRHPGRVLEANEIPPPELLSFIADQLDIDPGAFAEYRRRDQSRREQLADLMTRLWGTGASIGLPPEALSRGSRRSPRTSGDGVGSGYV
jgi:TnpA family transposase